MVATFALLLALAGPTDSVLIVRAVRFYRADPGQSPGITHVTAMLRFPETLPKPGATGEVSLAVKVRVVGAAGVLYEQSWQKRAPLPFPRGDADRVDVLSFSVASGSYQLEATVIDSVSKREARATIPIEAYAEPPQASDLLLSPWLRPVAAADTVPQPGEFRRGRLILAIAPEVAVGGEAASLAYLLETYSGTALAGGLTLTVYDAKGEVIRRAEPTPVRVVAGIGILTGQVAVGDLGPGRFRLVAELNSGGRTVARESWFAVDPAAKAVPASLRDETYFAGLAGRELDRAFAPLAVIADSGEAGGWPSRDDDDAKRAFLSEFWRKRDPTPATGNERRAQFYEGVLYANTYYSTGRGRVEGWRTDRGRIFLREGVPSQLVRRQARGTIPAYEIWRYLDRSGRYYVFADRGGRGIVIVVSNDPKEKTERRWQEILTTAGVREVVGLLGRTVLDGN